MKRSNKSYSFGVVWGMAVLMEVTNHLLLFLLKDLYLALRHLLCLFSFKSQLSALLLCGVFNHGSTFLFLDMPFSGKLINCSWCRISTYRQHRQTVRRLMSVDVALLLSQPQVAARFVFTMDFALVSYWWKTVTLNASATTGGWYNPRCLV